MSRPFWQGKYIFILIKTLIQAMSKFIAASRQATDLDKTRVLLERRIKEVKDESKRWAKAAAKANEGAKELQTQIEELKTDVVEKETRLDHLQKKNKGKVYIL